MKTTSIYLGKQAIPRREAIWAAAASSSNWVPTYVSGNSSSSNGGSNVSQMVELLTTKAARDLSFDPSIKK